MAARYLIDGSAAARWPKPAVAARLDRLAIAGELCIYTNQNHVVETL